MNGNWIERLRGELIRNRKRNCVNDTAGRSGSWPGTAISGIWDVI